MKPEKRERLSCSALLLDMDGVVLDSMPYHVAAWMKALREHGFNVNEEILYLYEGAIEPEIAVELFSSQGCRMSQEVFHKVLKRQKEIFVSDFRQKVRPFPEIPDILSMIKKDGRSLALVTSSHGEILDAVLPRELVLLFDRIVAGDQVKKRKPHPDPYLKAMKALGINGDKDAAAVENAPSGIKSAKNAGLKTIAITTTLPAERLKGADTVISSHAELLNVFE